MDPAIGLASCRGVVISNLRGTTPRLGIDFDQLYAEEEGRACLTTSREVRFQIVVLFSPFITKKEKVC